MIPREEFEKALKYCKENSNCIGCPAHCKKNWSNVTCKIRKEENIISLYDEIDRLKKESVWADAPEEALKSQTYFFGLPGMLDKISEHTRSSKQTRDEKIAEELASACFTPIQEYTGIAQAWLSKEELEKLIKEAIKRSKEE